LYLVVTVGLDLFDLTPTAV